jgi:hypothetical protein
MGSSIGAGAVLGRRAGATLERAVVGAACCCGEKCGGKLAAGNCGGGCVGAKRTFGGCALDALP